MKMKNIFFALFLAFGLMSCEVIGEDDRYIEVIPEATDRVVLLTEFTGWNCVNCPDAAQVANGLLDIFPNNVVVVGMHPMGHGFTTPAGAALDLRSQEAMDYLSYYGGSISTGLPAGVVNGRKYDGAYIQVYNKWNALVVQECTVVSQCLVDLHKSVAGEEFSVTVNLEPREGFNFPVSLQMWLVESGIVGAQNSHHGYITDYVHNHVFRKCLNGLWGDELGVVAEATEREYKFTVPAEYVANNCSVVAVLINTDTKEVVQAAEIALGEGAGH